MQRPTQHIIDAEAQKILQNLLPSEWAVRDLKPDYGIDYMVEIFENFQATGKVFYIQLKGSDQEIKDNTFHKQMDIGTLEYYSTHILPVLLVFVSINTKQVWGIWSNKLLEAYTYKKNQKSLKISLGEQYLLKDEVIRLLSANLYLSDKLGIKFKYSTEKEELLNDNIKNWIDKFWGEKISSEFNNLPNHITLEYTSKNNDISIKLITNEATHTVKLKNVEENNPYLFRPIFCEDDINDLNKEILKVLALSFARYSIKGSLALIIKLLGGVSFKQDDFDLLSIVSLAKHNNEVPLLIKTVKKMIDVKLYDISLSFCPAFFIYDNEDFEYHEARVEILNYYIKNIENDSLRGIAYYNLGNTFNGKINQRQAFLHYMKAIKFNSDYKNRPYWWRECAGLLFLTGHYKWAEHFYLKTSKLKSTVKEKSYFRVELRPKSEENILNALIGDCLFFQGKFEKAKLFFKHYFSLENSPSAEWLIKDSVCDYLISNGLDNITFNRALSSHYMAEAEKLFVIKNSNVKDILSRSLEAYPLNGLAWFNLAFYESQEKNEERALWNYLTCALIQTWDSEAQMNSILLAIQLKEMEILSLLIQYFIDMNDFDIINQWANFISKQKVSLKEKKYLITSFSEMVYGVHQTLEKEEISIILS